MTQDERFDRIDAALERLGRRADQRFDALTQYVADFRTETIGRLEGIETRMRLLSGSHESFDARISVVTKAGHENAAAISWLMGRQMEQTLRLFASQRDLAERVTKLEDAVAKLEGAA